MLRRHPKLQWLLKGTVLCGCVALLAFYIQFRHQEANPPKEPYGDLLIGGGLNRDPMETLTQASASDALGKPVTIMLGSKSISQPIFTTRKTSAPSQASAQRASESSYVVPWSYSEVLDPTPPELFSGSKSGAVFRPRHVLNGQSGIANPEPTKQP
jgi:hypothetical protein